jgi:hypothetical protein
MNDRWHVLREAVSSGGFPFLVWYGDYKSCNHWNWKKKHSIPLFTTCAHIDCQYSLPLPYDSNSQASSKTGRPWTRTQAKSKIRKLVWRGSLSGKNDDMQSARWRLGKLVTEQDATGLFDVGLSLLFLLPAFHEFYALGHYTIRSLVGWNRPPTANSTCRQTCRFGRKRPCHGPCHHDSRAWRLSLTPDWCRRAWCGLIAGCLVLGPYVRLPMWLEELESDTIQPCFEWSPLLERSTRN